MFCAHSHSKRLAAHPPEPGDLVQLRSRRWLVEGVEPASRPDSSPVVRLACADDDAQGQELQVYWKYELDRRILKDEGWQELGGRFDDPRHFAAFFHTLRWNCVTATDPNLVQAPFRAGITLDAYQMEPLRKALRLPRVNLFIADDTGLGKTIEAGLIARELLLRKKVNRIVVAAPPSVLEQWKGEMEERFGLVFEILDRAYVARMRQERGFGVNPWRTHSRFLVSHRLLPVPAYADPMREWLGALLPGSLLILDEAHHAAPSSGGRYGNESEFTRAVRDLSERFEHRLFLSATPHNGHSNSFSTLLELLDPYRFTRGVKVQGLKDVMVRRLKEDVRRQLGGFPKRNVEPVVVDGLPPDAPEIVLSQLLDEYRTAREERHAHATARQQATDGLLVVGLQQRLLSSIEAFALSLAVHRETVQRYWDHQNQAGASKAAPASSAETQTPRSATSARRTSAKEAKCLFLSAPGADDEHERDEWTDEQAEKEERRQIEALTWEAEGEGFPMEPSGKPSEHGNAIAQWANEQRLLDQMQEIAEGARWHPDAKTHYLIDWIRRKQCPDLPPFGRPPPPGAPKPRWTNRRVLIFTENRVGTKPYLHKVLDQAIEHTDQADFRIEVIDGSTRGPRRKAVQRRFNARPEDDPLRILIATDAAREGLNFQAHCTDLFHFDLPWNPGRIEQRNGRIDRKLQPADEVNCHYFVLPQRVEDHVLDVLVRKTERIKRELGSLSKVIEDDLEGRLRNGIRHNDADELRRAIEGTHLDQAKKLAAEEELEAARNRGEELKHQIEGCRRLLDRSRRWVRFEPESFRDALSCSLELLGTQPLTRDTDADGNPVWTLPPLDRKAAADPTWNTTLDSLRVPKKIDQKLADWRRDAPIRPVVFKDKGVLTDEIVHLHLEQRVAQRLLARFRALGFVHDDLSRACLAQTRDSIPRVVLLGRLSLYGQRAERLHEVLVPVTARWSDPSQRRDKPLRAYARDAESLTLELLDDALASGADANGDHSGPNEIVRRRLLRSAAQDVADLKPQLEERAVALASVAEQRLAERGARESSDLRQTLERQRDRVKNELDKHESQSQLELGLSASDRRKREANMNHWRLRLEGFDKDMEREPARIRAFYEVRARRVEPVGLVYLWPETN